jgi:PmbA protein
MSLELMRAAKAKFGQAEVYRVESESRPVTFEANRLKELSVRETSGVALRVINRGRIGFTSTTNSGDESSLVTRAGDLSEYGAAASFSFAPAGRPPQVDVFDENVAGVSQESMIKTGQALIDRVRDAWPEMLCEARAGASTGRTEIWNSEGLEQGYQSSGYHVYLGGKLIRGTDMLMLWVGHASSHMFGEQELSGLVGRLLQQLDYCREIVPAPPAGCPVLFTPRGVAATMLGPLLEGFSGQNIATGASPITGKEGQRLFDRRLSVYDDPTLPRAAASRPCDDEGVPSRRLALIEHGVVGEAYFDLQSAGKAGRRSTGSAHRGLTSPPAPGTTTIDIAPGDTPYDEMIADMDDGLVVEELLGAGQGNELGGEFRANVSLGYRVQDGQITGRVKDTMISGNVYQALDRMEAISSTSEWVFGSVRAPAIRCAGIEVATGARR